MATKENALVEESLKCSICLALIRDPVTIACGHNFCHKCLKVQFDEKSHSPTCPQCLEPAGIFDTELRINSVLSNIARALEGNLGKVQIASCLFACQVCGAAVDSSSGTRCSDCKITYCFACRTTCHPDRGIFTKHKMQVLEEKPYKYRGLAECLLHEKDLVYFCFDCSKAVCIDCHNESHKTHTKGILSDACSNERARIRSLITDSGLALNNFSTTVESLKQHVSSMKNAQAKRISLIQECFQTLKLALNAKENELLADEVEIVAEPIDRFEMALNKAKTQLLYQNSVHRVAEAALSDDLQLQCLLISKPLKNALENTKLILSALDNDPVPELPRVPNIVDITEVTNLISLLGFEPDTHVNNNESEGCPKEKHQVQETDKISHKSTHTLDTHVSSHSTYTVKDSSERKCLSTSEYQRTSENKESEQSSHISPNNTFIASSTGRALNKTSENEASWDANAVKSSRYYNYSGKVLTGSSKVGSTGYGSSAAYYPGPSSNNAYNPNTSHPGLNENIYQPENYYYSHTCSSNIENAVHKSEPDSGEDKISLYPTSWNEYPSSRRSSEVSRKNCESEKVSSKHESSVQDESSSNIRKCKRTATKKKKQYEP